MTLNSLSNEYRNQLIDKWQYIDQMYDIHKILFEYANFIIDTNIEKIEISNGEVIMTFKDSLVKMVCAYGDKRIAPIDSLNFNNYELEELNLQLKLMKDVNNIIDIGGNYGWYAIHVAKKYPLKNILSFEPIPFTYKQLIKNIGINDVNNIKAFNFGFSEEMGDFDFFYDPELTVNASMKNVSDKLSALKVVCHVSTLDIFDKERPNQEIGFIKCDIEGAELLAFKGAENVLKKSTPIVFTEILRKWTAKYNYHPNDLIIFFKKLNYKCFVCKDCKLFPFEFVDDETIDTNYFFLHELNHKDLILKYS